MISPVVEEAAKLAAALEGWLRARTAAGTAGAPDSRAMHAGGAARTSGLGAAGLGGSLAAGLAAAQAHLGGCAECTLCPVCQLLALAHGTSPEVWEHLAASVASLGAAASALGQVRAAAARERERPQVQRIDIG